MAEITSPPVIPAISTPVPSRLDPESFSVLMDRFLSEMPVTVDGMNVVVTWIYDVGVLAQNNALAAGQSATSAAQYAQTAQGYAEQSEHNAQSAAQSVQDISDLIEAFNGSIGLPNSGALGAALVQSAAGLVFTEYAVGKQALAHATPRRELNSNSTAQVFQVIGINAETAVRTITLPANPKVGDWVRFYDSHAAWDQNNPVIARNGQKIMGLDEDMVVNMKGQNFTLTYISSTRGWVIT